MTRCIVCRRAIDGPSLIDGESGQEVHPSCFAERLPHDAAAVLLAGAALLLIPFIRVWSA